MENFDLRKFLTENKLTNTSKKLDESSDIRKFTHGLLKKWKKNPRDEKLRKAVEWYAGSVYGTDLPNNLHRKNVNTHHIKSMIDSINNAREDYAQQQIKSLKKRLNENVNEGIGTIRKIVKTAKKKNIDNWDDLEKLIRDEFPRATGADFTSARKELERQGILK